MSDSEGDGWNGGLLEITSGAQVYSFSLNGDNDDGKDSTVTFIVTNGQSLKLSWIPGFFDNEVSFILRDYEGDLVYSKSFPTAGQLFSGLGACPDCIEPANVRTENVYDTYAKLRWSPVSLKPSLGWWVIYGPKGFVPGPGVGDSVYVTTPKLTLTGLSKKTDYDFYVHEMCDSTVFPPLVGPVSFQTYWSDDVGISGVVTPVNGCDLGVETVTIVMSNYGAQPQSLIPFRYSVNGLDAGVPQPEDGFYTGVIGKDSATVIEFETQYDFSEPGEYLITVYTQMMGDEDASNDTFRYYFTNRIVPPHIQNFENWNGGWSVDTAKSVNASWEYGQPANTVISAAASGAHAWVTNLDGPANPFEFSYLISPCYDFSGIAEDPAIEFSIIYSNSQFSDGGFLEMTTDDGMSWNKVGSKGEGANWYNYINTNVSGLGDVWAGDSEGWKTARNRLKGLAGESAVRFRIGYRSFLVEEEGMGIDDVRVFVPFKNDLYAQHVTTAGQNGECGQADDRVTFTFSNFGTTPQSFFLVGYSVNDGPPVIELISATVPPDGNFLYTFNTPFDSRNQLSNIKCWTSLSNEQDLSNDTVYYSIDHMPNPVPFQENFESGLLPAKWEADIAFVTAGHDNNSFVLAHNLFDQAPAFQTTLPRYGVINAGDTLTFDYRIVNYPDGNAGTTLSAGTKIDLQISADCGPFQTVYTINTSTHTPSVNLRTVRISLDNFANQSVQARFSGTWSAGDFYFDLDHVNLRACAADMQLSADVLPSTNGQNGAATVQVGLGNPPYNYLWSNDSTSQTISGLPVGQYKVTVTDALGCTDELTVNVGSVANQEIEGLTAFSIRPNPTEGIAQVLVAFDRPVDAQMAVINLLGQLVWETNAAASTALTESIDLTQLPDGLYLIRLTVAGQTAMKKLVKGR